MGLLLVVEKEEETPDHCVYAFGPSETTVGRVQIHKSSGDLELITLSETDELPDERFYLANLVPRLQEYHAQDSYPDRDQWTT